jgi:hypothetical protein
MAKHVKQDPAAKHNPTTAERDERVTAPDVDPEEFLEALLQVDPESEPVIKDGPKRA